MTFTVEYSVRQDCFHIAELEETLNNNLRTSVQQIDIDYRILGIYNTYQEAQGAADGFRKMVEQCKEKH